VMTTIYPRSNERLWPEPGERMRLLRNFANECHLWYECRRSPCYVARRSLYAALVHRHEAEAVLRWQPAIKAVLDRAEAWAQLQGEGSDGT
jgi:hypothetical protein